MTDIDTTIDKLDSHHRQQLSALMDGELSPDEARFLLRRLQHDGELSAFLGRWQLAGDALRGQVGEILPAGFCGRVAKAIEQESVQATTKAPGWLRGSRGLGLAGLAASVALAVVVAQRLPEPSPSVATAPVAVAAPAPSSLPAIQDIDKPRLSEAASTAAVGTAPPDDLPNSSPSLRQADAAATTALIAAAAERESRQVDNGAGIPEVPSSRATPISVAPAAGAQAIAASAQRRPFTPPALPQSRPWPRSPASEHGLMGQGVPADMFTVSFGDASAANTGAFYPFEPQPTTGPADSPPWRSQPGQDANPRLFEQTLRRPEAPGIP